MSSRTVTKLRWALHQFLRDCRAVSAIEFALLLPLMLSIYIGGNDLAFGLSAQFKATLAARTVADLASQYVVIDNPTMTGILGAASTVMAPLPNNVVVIVSEVTTDANGNGTITWSAAQNAQPYAAGTAVNLPAQLHIPNVAIILGEVTYPYTPPVSYEITGTFNIYENAYFFPRRIFCVTYNSVC
jgi:Flp pilus assembly protein TadG